MAVSATHPKRRWVALAKRFDRARITLLRLWPSSLFGG
jgi:hypothetical protein